MVFGALNWRAGLGAAWCAQGVVPVSGPACSALQPVAVVGAGLEAVVGAGLDAVVGASQGAVWWLQVRWQLLAVLV